MAIWLILNTWMRLVIDVHLTHPFAHLEMLVKDKYANDFAYLKGIESRLWWLQLVMKESMHTLSHWVPTI